MNQFYTAILALCFFINIPNVVAQQDSTRKMSFSGIPVLTSAPETGIRYGAFGQLSFDLYKNNFDSRQSQAYLALSHSTRNQLSVGGGFLFFGRSERFAISGEFDYAF